MEKCELNNLVKNSFFFAGENGVFINNDYLKSIDLSEISLLKDFYYILYNYFHHNLITFNLNDLLNIDASELLKLKNCNIIIIRRVRSIIMCTELAWIDIRNPEHKIFSIDDLENNANLIRR